MRKLVFAGVAVVLGLTVALVLAELALRLTHRPFPVADRMGRRSTGGDERVRVSWSSPGRRAPPFASSCSATRRSRPSRPRSTTCPKSTCAGPSPTPRAPASASCRSGAAGGARISSCWPCKPISRAIHPAAVVLWFTEGNDLWNNTFPTHFPKDGWPKPTFWLEGTRAQGTEQSMAWTLSSARTLPSAGGPSSPGTCRTTRPTPSGSPICRRRIARVTAPPGTPPLVQVLAEQSGIRPDEVPYFSAENFDTEKTHYSIYLVPESPRLQYAAALTRALLVRIQTSVRSERRQVLRSDHRAVEHEPHP